MNPSLWGYHGNVIDLGEPCETCQLCSQPDLRYHFEIVHRDTDEGMWIGSECIKKFNIGVIRDGQLLGRRAAKQAVDQDRRAIEKQARTRSVLNSLVQLAAADPDFEIDSFIRYYADRGAFTPNQMGVLQWRLAAKVIQHNARHFTVSLRRGREQHQIEKMEDWKRDKLDPYLSPAQKKRWGK